MLRGRGGYGGGGTRPAAQSGTTGSSPARKEKLQRIRGPWGTAPSGDGLLGSTWSLTSWLSLDKPLLFCS